MFTIQITRTFPRASDVRQADISAMLKLKHEISTVHIHYARLRERVEIMAALGLLSGETASYNLGMEGIGSGEKVAYKRARSISMAPKKTL